MKKYLIMAVLPVVGGLSLLAAVPSVEASTSYTLADVQTHNTAASCWIVNSNKVYDLTSYINAHPIGAVIAKNLCGTSLHIPFTTAPLAENTLNIGLIGDLATTTDTIIPVAPTNLVTKIKNYNKVKLSWTAASDNIAVIGYKIFRDNILVANTHSLVFNDHKLIASTTYQYAIIAYDKAGNNSATSTVVTVTTPIKKVIATPVINPKHDQDNNKDKKEYKQNDKKTVNKFLKEFRSNLRSK